MEELFDCVMDIGEKLLVSGAEIHRVEDSIERMCTALGFERTDIFIITTVMVASVKKPDGTILSQNRRIKRLGMDFERVHRLNDLSRRICREKPSAEEIRKMTAEAYDCDHYPLWVECLAYSLIAAAFTVFFGGGLTDAVFSLVTGVLVRIVVKLTDYALTNGVFSKFLSSLIATTLAYTFYKLGALSNIDKVLIGNIMTLIPGIGLTNAFRDLFTGDSITAILRLTEAALTALAIAAGYILIALIGGAVL